MIPDPIKDDISARGGIEGIVENVPDETIIAQQCRIHNALSMPVRLTILYILLIQPICEINIITNDIFICIKITRRILLWDDIRTPATICRSPARYIFSIPTKSRYMPFIIAVFFNVDKMKIYHYNFSRNDISTT